MYLTSPIHTPHRSNPPTVAMLDRGPVPMSQRGLLVFYGIPAFVFAIMLFIEKAQADDLLQMGTCRACDDMDIYLIMVFSRL